MSQIAENNSKPPPRPMRVGLVAGEDTLVTLGSLVRTLVVGLLDEPLAVTLVCPAGADLGTLPAPPVDVVRYTPRRWPFAEARASAALAAELRAGGVTLLHALDQTALPLTRRLAEPHDADYVVSLFSLHPPARLLDARARAVLAASEPVRRRCLSAGLAADTASLLVRPGVHAAHSADCFTNPQYAAAIVAAGDFAAAAPFRAVLEAFAELRAGGRHQSALIFFHCLRLLNQLTGQYRRSPANYASATAKAARHERWG